MTHPTSREVARVVRAYIAKGGFERPYIATVAGLTERQLRRRLDGETPFAAHELLAIMRVLDRGLIDDLAAA